MSNKVLGAIIGRFGERKVNLEDFTGQFVRSVPVYRQRRHMLHPDRPVGRSVRLDVLDSRVYRVG
jgi:hypothetical protein